MDFKENVKKSYPNYSFKKKKRNSFHERIYKTPIFYKKIIQNTRSKSSEGIELISFKIVVSSSSASST